MKNIKLIALDLDGTLLDNQKSLPCKNEEAIKKCIKQGIEIVPCTGRILSGIPEFLKDISGIRYAITVNGAVVVDMKENCVISACKINAESAIEMLQLAKQLGIVYDVYIDDCGYTQQCFLDEMKTYEIEEKVFELILKTRKVVPDVIEMVRKSGSLVEKINYFFPNNSQKRKKIREELSRREDIAVSAAFSYNLEVNAKEATKGNAIYALASHLQISPNETMAIGDGENDLSMMEMAGIGVAMGNAISEVKMIADYVTTTNEMAGVAKAISALVLEE